MTKLEVFAVVMSLISVVLTIRPHVICWPTGILGVLAYFGVFVPAKLYADAVLQIVYLVQNVYGWWFWVRGGARGTEREIGVMAIRARVGVAAATALASVAVGAGLARWTDASFPFADATLSVTSLVANWLLARKLVENWVLWVAADAGYVVVFWRKGLHLSSGLYAVFFVLAAAGLVEWYHLYRARSLRQMWSATAEMK